MSAPQNTKLIKAINYQRILTIIDTMYEYQDINNIKPMCAVNTAFLYNLLKTYTDIDVKVKSVLFFNKLNNKTAIVSTLVFDIDDDIIIPSYRLTMFKYSSYFETYGDLIDFIDKDPCAKATKDANKGFYLKLLQQHLNNKKYEKLITDNNITGILDMLNTNPENMKYYDNIAEHTYDLLETLQL
jgi:hypothetical protein